MSSLRVIVVGAANVGKSGEPESGERICLPRVSIIDSVWS